MNPELQQQLSDLLSSLKDGAVWAGQQIPPLVQEKILFGRVWETALALMFIAITLALLYACKRLWVYVRDEDDDWAPGVGLLAVAAFIMGMLTVIQLNSVVLVWLAPRLYVVEWLSGFVIKH